MGGRYLWVHEMTNSGVKIRRVPRYLPRQPRHSLTYDDLCRIPGVRVDRHADVHLDSQTGRTLPVRAHRLGTREGCCTDTTLGSMCWRHLTSSSTTSAGLRHNRTALPTLAMASFSSSSVLLRVGVDASVHPPWSREFPSGPRCALDLFELPSGAG